MKVKAKKLHPNAIVPTYMSPGASGFDLHALDTVTVHPDSCKPIRTGLSFEIPEGYELQIRPRSGTTLNTPIRIANAPGTVDSDFRGEVLILVDNIMSISYTDIVIKKGQRIAQGIIQKVERVQIEIAQELSTTERGLNGLGSTGTTETVTKLNTRKTTTTNNQGTEK